MKETEDCYEFEDYNMFSKDKFTKEEAIKYNDTLKFCTHCLNCKDSYQIHNCTNVSGGAWIENVFLEVKQ